MLTKVEHLGYGVKVKQASSDIWNDHFKAVYNNDLGDDADTVIDTEYFDDKEDDDLDDV